MQPTNIPDFERSSMWSDVEDVIHSTSPQPIYDYKALVHTVKEDIEVWDLFSIETVRDYATKISDSPKILFKIGLGDYVNRLFPYRENLEVTIRKIPLKGNGEERSEKRPVVVTRYKAVFNPGANPQVGGSELETQDPHSLNTQDIVDVMLELVDRSVEFLRIKTTGGSYFNKTYEEMIRGLMGGESVRVLVDGKPCLEGLDLVPPDNNERQSQVILPHGLRLTSLPTYLQENLAGVYNRGIGTYFQIWEKRKTWFIYPLYDIERFDKGDKRAVFYSVPQEKLPGMDRTYVVEGDVLKIISTAQRKYKDSAETDQMNGGSGFRVADARPFMKKPVKIDAGGPIADRGRLNHESVHKGRDDDLNFAPYLNTGATSNPFSLRSVVNSNVMGQIDLVWENSDISLIYPGMPCKYVYLSQGKPISLKGTILFVHEHVYKNDRTRKDAVFRSNARISIVCEPQSKKPELPKVETIGDEWLEE